MNIQLQHIIPNPLQNNYEEDSIWNKNIILETANNYLVKAASGKGKSTLLSYIMGLRNDYNGNLFIDNKNTAKFNLNDWAELRKNKLSIVFQDLRLFNNLTAIQNIELKQQLSNSTTKDEILQMADALEISHLLNKQAQYLSMGQQQRIAIIRALVQPFKWLLLDEPYSHIDKKNREKAEILITQYCEINQAGIILTSLGEINNLQYNQILTV